MSAAKHTFSYRFIDDTKFIRPYIPMSLRSKNGSIPSLLALVDSGADFCMVDGALASVLDLDLSLLQQIELSGINGSAVGYVAHLEIGVHEHFIPAPVVFSLYGYKWADTDDYTRAYYTLNLDVICMIDGEAWTEVKVVVCIFELALSGYSIKAIARRLTELGIPTRKGKTYWQPGTVGHLLANEAYTGIAKAMKWK